MLSLLKNFRSSNDAHCSRGEEETRIEQNNDYVVMVSLLKESSSEHGWNFCTSLPYPIKIGMTCPCMFEARTYRQCLETMTLFS